LPWPWSRPSSSPCGLSLASSTLCFPSRSPVSAQLCHRLLVLIALALVHINTPSPDLVGGRQVCAPISSSLARARTPPGRGHVYLLLLNSRLSLLRFSPFTQDPSQHHDPNVSAPYLTPTQSSNPTAEQRPTVTSSQNIAISAAALTTRQQCVRLLALKTCDIPIEAVDLSL